MSQNSLHFRMAQDKLARLLNQAVKAIPKKSKPGFPVLDFLLLEGSFTTTSEEEEAESLLKLTAYNGEFAIEVTVQDFELVREGRVLLPAFSLSDLVTSLPAKQMVEVKVENREEVLIYCGSSHNTLKGYYSIEDFPLVTSQMAASPSPVLLMTAMLRKTIGQVTFAASEDENIRNTHNVCLRFGEKEAAFASTDGMRLALKQIPVAYVDPAQYKPFQALLAADTLEIVRSLLDETEYSQVEVGLNTRGTMLVFKSGSSEKFRLTASVVEGAFPEYKNIIPTEYRTKVVVAVEELIRATRVASICLKNTRDSAYKWNFWLNIAGRTGANCDGSGTLTVGSNSTEGSSQTPLEVLVEGDANQVALQPEKFLQILKVLDPKRIVLEMEDKTRPLVIKPYEYEAGEKWIFLQVPVSLTIPQNSKVEAGSKKVSPNKEGQIEEIETEAEVEAEAETVAEEAETNEELEAAEAATQEVAGDTFRQNQAASEETSQERTLLAVGGEDGELEGEEDTLD